MVACIPGRVPARWALASWPSWPGWPSTPAEKLFGVSRWGYVWLLMLKATILIKSHIVHVRTCKKQQLFQTKFA